MPERFIPKEARMEHGEYPASVLALAEQARQGKATIATIEKSDADPYDKAALLLGEGAEEQATDLLRRGGRESLLNEQTARRFTKMEREETARILRFTPKQKRGGGLGKLVRGGIAALAFLGFAEGCASAPARGASVERQQARAEYLQKDGEFETTWGNIERKGGEIEKAQVAFDTADATIAQALATWSASLGTDEEADATERLISAIEEFEKAQTKLAAAQEAYETAMTPNYPPDTSAAARQAREVAKTALEGIEAKKIAVSKAWKDRDEARKQHGDQSKEFGTANIAVGIATNDYKTAGGDTALEAAELAFTKADEEVRGFVERSAAKEAIDDARAEIAPAQQEASQAAPITALEALGSASAPSPTEDTLQKTKIQLQQAERGVRGLDVRKRELQRLITGREQDIASFGRQMNEPGVKPERRANLQTESSQRQRDITRFQTEIIAIDGKLAEVDRLQSEEAALQNTLTAGPDANRTAREAAQRAVEQYKGKHATHVGAVRAYEGERQKWDIAYGAGAAHAAVERLRAEVIPAQTK